MITGKPKVRTRHWLMLATLMITFFIGLTLVQAEDASQSPGSRNHVLKYVLKNGLTILIKPTNANKVVTADAFIRMGALYESKDKRGISALMQRVLSKGTTTRGAREIAFAAESAGSTIDAEIADYHYGRVALKSTLSGMETGLDLFLDVLCHPTFPDAEVAKERDLLIQELSAYKDQPTSYVYRNFISLFYEDRSMGVPPEVMVENLKQMKRDDLVSWYKKVYVPRNMIISIVGNVHPDLIYQKIERALGEVPEGKLLPAVSNVNSAFLEDRQVIKHKDSQALFMIVGYPAPAINEADYPVMEVVSYILGGDMGSRLFVELRDKKGLAYTVSTIYNAGDYPSHILAFIATKPSNYQSVKNGLLTEFNRIANEPVDPAELAEAKQAIRGRFMMAHETNASQSGMLGMFEISGLGYRYDQAYPDLVAKVTAEDIRRVAKKYLNHYAMSVVSPGDIKE